MSKKKFTKSNKGNEGYKNKNKGMYNTKAQTKYNPIITDEEDVEMMNDDQIQIIQDVEAENVEVKTVEYEEVSTASMSELIGDDFHDYIYGIMGDTNPPEGWVDEELEQRKSEQESIKPKSEMVTSFIDCEPIVGELHFDKDAINTVAPIEESEDDVQVDFIKPMTKEEFGSSDEDIKNGVDYSDVRINSKSEVSENIKIGMDVKKTKIEKASVAADEEPEKMPEVTEFIIGELGYTGTTILNTELDSSIYEVISDPKFDENGQIIEYATIVYTSTKLASMKNDLRKSSRKKVINKLSFGLI